MPAEHWLEGSALLDKSFSEALAEVFQLEVTVNDEACREILTAVEALVKGNRAGRACAALMTLGGFLREGTEDSAASMVRKAASGKVAQMNFEQVAEEDDSLKVLGCYLIAVFVGALFSGEQHSQFLTQYLLPPTGNLVL